MSRHQTEQVSMHAPPFDIQSKQSSKQPFSRGIKASISNLKIEDDIKFENRRRYQIWKMFSF